MFKIPKLAKYFNLFLGFLTFFVKFLCVYTTLCWNMMSVQTSKQLQSFVVFVVANSLSKIE